MDTFSESDPYVRLMLNNVLNGQWTDIGTTEMQMNQKNPDFSKSILVDYIFETH
jgi:hypothetical protein